MIIEKAPPCDHRENTTKSVLCVMMLPVYTIASSKIAIAACVALVCAGKFGQRTTSDIQRAYDAAPGPPAKGAVQEEGPSAPPASGPSSGLKSCLYLSPLCLLLAKIRQT